MHPVPGLRAAQLAQLLQFLGGWLAPRPRPPRYVTGRLHRQPYLQHRPAAMTWTASPSCSAATTASPPRPTAGIAATRHRTRKDRDLPASRAYAGPIPASTSFVLAKILAPARKDAAGQETDRGYVATGYRTQTSRHERVGSVQEG